MRVEHAVRSSSTTVQHCAFVLYGCAMCMWVECTLESTEYSTVSSRCVYVVLYRIKTQKLKQSIDYLLHTLHRILYCTSYCLLRSTGVWRRSTGPRWLAPTPTAVHAAPQGRSRAAAGNRDAAGDGCLTYTETIVRSMLHVFMMCTCLCMQDAKKPTQNFNGTRPGWLSRAGPASREGEVRPSIHNIQYGRVLYALALEPNIQ